MTLEELDKLKEELCQTFNRVKRPILHQVFNKFLKVQRKERVVKWLESHVKNNMTPEEWDKLEQELNETFKDIDINTMIEAYKKYPELERRDCLNQWFEITECFWCECFFTCIKHIVRKGQDEWYELSPNIYLPPFQKRVKEVISDLYKKRIIPKEVYQYALRYKP
jgi:hypothetical protein